jgi:hypothetical protein
MARSNQPPPKQPANLSPQQITAGIERLTKRLEELQRFDPTSVIPVLVEADSRGGIPESAEF